MELIIFKEKDFTIDPNGWTDANFIISGGAEMKSTDDMRNKRRAEVAEGRGFSRDPSAETADYL
jgi:hypothetical protein